MATRPRRVGNLSVREASSERAAKHLIWHRFLFAKEVFSARAYASSRGAQLAQLDDIPEPPDSQGSVLVRTLALGVYGTDREIVSGAYGEAPPGSERLVLGHESYGEVISAQPGGPAFAAGDRLVGIVRRPDPALCPACAAGEWDMCRNGGYTERGIKGLHGFGWSVFVSSRALRSRSIRHWANWPS